MNLMSLVYPRYARARRALCEAIGVGRYSYLALNDLDRKIERHLDFDAGFFVEAGANDGMAQSNTYYFEKVRGWTGLLVEPVPELAEICRRNRRAEVRQAALVDKEVPGATIELHFAGLMSTVTGALGDAESTARHVAVGLAVQNLPSTRRLAVPARTLSALLDDIELTTRIDLLSLDVEGGEIGALRGLDFSRHAPQYICIETRDTSAVTMILEPRYRLEEILTDLGTHRDLLYRLR